MVVGWGGEERRKKDKRGSVCADQSWGGGGRSVGGVGVGGGAPIEKEGPGQGWLPE